MGDLIDFDTDTLPDITTRHGFLEALHLLLCPKLYLEVGVQHGTSIRLAHAAELAVGIDPHPLIEPTGNMDLYRCTSDQFFDAAGTVRPGEEIDLGFIDGFHSASQAMRDFCGIELRCGPGSVVVFDDVLPRNQFEARRHAPDDEIVGDWTGDVWKVDRILHALRPGLTRRLVDVQPTGVLVVSGFPDETGLAAMGYPTPDFLRAVDLDDPPVPSGVFNRSDALRPLVALQQLRQERERA